MEALDFLLNRRSVLAKTLVAPPPPRAVVETCIAAGVRVPDHKVLSPWRFLVLERAALDRLAERLYTRALEKDLGEDKATAARDAWREAPLTVAVIASPKDRDDLPEVEQTLSAGAACAAVLNGALAQGWGANWITGWMAYDRHFLEELGLKPQEFVAGYIHMGTISKAPSERRRATPEDVTSWVSG